MHILDLINRKPDPAPWSEGDKIPWDEPAFSARMLKEHLNQEHDAASRRSDKIDAHVEWIHHVLLSGKPGRILDLGCGPGLYTSRLTHLGHCCTGIDYSPASIAYAAAFMADQEDDEHQRCSYVFDDIRSARYGHDYDLVMLIYGEFNTFSRLDARLILHKAREALRPGGLLLLEPHNETFVRMDGISGPSWYSSRGGLFSEKPHLVLTESIWNEVDQATTRRYYVIDGETHAVSRYAETMQAYTREQYFEEMAAAGYCNVTTYPSLMGGKDRMQDQLFALVARKPLEKPPEA